MAAKNLKDELRKLDEEEARIRKQREQLTEQAKADALEAVQSALKELNALGYNYRLVEGGRAASTSRASSGTRRTGIREEVYAAIKKAGPDGIAPAGIREKLGMVPQDKSAAQSVANALTALKKSNRIADKDGAYVVA